MKNIIMTAILVCVSSNSYSAAWSNWAIPTQIDVERGGGFMVYGAFGNPNGCSVGDRFYVAREHPQYQEIYSSILAAFSSEKEVRVHIRDCEAVSWYATSETNFNVLKATGSVSIRKPGL